MPLGGYLADMGSKAAHLGDAAGVGGDGAVGVDRDGDAGGCKHTDGCKRDAVEITGDGVGDVDANGYQNYGNPSTHHADGNAGDNGGSGAGLGLSGDALDGFIIVGGVDLGDEADDKADDKSCDYRKSVVYLAEEGVAEHDGQHRDNDGGNVGAHLERLMRVGVILAAHKEGCNNGTEDADSRDCQRVDRTGTGEQPLN